MDIAEVLKELRDERERLGEAIMSLERLAAGREKRRGRPPKWMTGLSSAIEPAESVEPVKRRRPGRPRKNP